MSDSIQKGLAAANRQVDGVIRDIAQMKGAARDARTVSKAMLIMKLEALEGRARELERTLEIMTIATRGPEFEG